MAKVNLSATTRSARNISIISYIASLVSTILPVIVYTGIAFAQGDVRQKFTLGLTLMIAIILVVVNVIFKYHLRSAIWIVVLGIYFCIKNIMPLLLILAIGTVLDEFIFTPVYKRYREKYKVNKEIDRRLPEC